MAQGNNTLRTREMYKKLKVDKYNIMYGKRKTRKIKIYIITELYYSCIEILLMCFVPLVLGMNVCIHLYYCVVAGICV